MKKRFKIDSSLAYETKGIGGGGMGGQKGEVKELWRKLNMRREMALGGKGIGLGGKGIGLGVRVRR